MTLTIALDGMGGDDAPKIVVDGAARAVGQDPDLRFLLFGPEDRLGPLLSGKPELAKLVELRHTDDAVAADAKPTTALRQGRRSSMRLAIDAVKAGEAAAAVSAGNTGALMAMAKVVLKTLPGIERPAICGLFPTRRREVVALDLGANVDCTASHLVQFAVMGDVFARVMLDLEKPTVGLLNVGTEELKGDTIVREAAGILRSGELPIDFAGFVEGSDIVEGAVDVFVTDGFTGNVALKVAEGTARMLMRTIRDNFAGSWRGRLGYIIARPVLRDLRDRFDPRHHNGAMLVGLNGVVVKSHGGTDALGFSVAVAAAAGLVRKKTNDHIIDEMRTLRAATTAEADTPRAAAS